VRWTEILDDIEEAPELFQRIECLPGTGGVDTFVELQANESRTYRAGERDRLDD